MVDKILKIENLKDLSLDALLDAYKNGYRIEEKNLSGSSCPSCASAKKLVEQQRIENPGKLLVTNELQSSNGEPLSLAAGICPAGPLYVGQKIRFSSAISGGTAPYTVAFYAPSSGIGIPEFQVTTGVVPVIYDYIIKSADVGTSRVFRIDVIDSCIGIPKGTGTSSCTVASILNCPAPAVTLTVTII